MKDIILTILAAATLFAAGCSHNANMVGVGKVFRIGNESANILYVNGLISINGTRENAESTVETDDDDGNGEAMTAKSVRRITYRTGRQITGYLVDLAKVDPEAAKAYVENINEAENKEK